MLWKRHTSDHRPKYVAVLEIEDCTTSADLYGQRAFKFKLADGTTEEFRFEAEDWRAWSAALGKGGCVINER